MFRDDRHLEAVKGVSFQVRAGEILALIERDHRGVSIAFANIIFHQDRTNRDGIEKVLAVPALSGSWQRSFQELKNKL